MLNKNAFFKFAIGRTFSQEEFSAMTKSDTEALSLYCN